MFSFLFSSSSVGLDTLGKGGVKLGALDGGLELLGHGLLDLEKCAKKFMKKTLFFINVGQQFDSKLTKSSPLGMRTFISVDLADMIEVWSESLLKYIWHPSVFSTEIVGTAPKTWSDKKREKNSLSRAIKIIFRTHLHLDRLAVNELARADDVIKDDSGLLASIQDDVVAFPVDTDGRTFAAEHVDGLVHLNLVNHNVGIAPEKKKKIIILIYLLQFNFFIFIT